MTSQRTYRFGGIELDVARRALVRDGDVVALQKKPLDLLLYLIERRQRAVGKDEILRDVWPDEYVSDSSLAVCVRKIRKALGDGESNAPIIATLHGFGYRFVAHVDGDDIDRDAGGDLARRAPPRLVGRDADLTVLRAAWRRACAGHRQVVLVCGEGGVGKTTLVQAFLDELGTHGGDVGVLQGDCLDLRGGHEPYLPLLDAWTQACRGPRGAMATDILRRCAPGWLLQLHGVVPREERARLQEDARGVMPERLLRMLASAFNELATLRPTILVVEDLHWADPATLDALTRIARDREPVPLLLLATLRSELGGSARRPLFDWLTSLRRQRVATEILLECLDAGTVAEFLATGAAKIAPASDLPTSLWERTGGHPLFLSAVVRHLERGGRLDELPPELHTMIDFEFEALPPPEQRLVEAGAVVGREFAAALVAAALDAPIADVEEAALGIVRGHRILELSGVVEWPDGTASRRFRFRHPYYGEVALERAAKARQRGWHQRIAARLSGAYPQLPGTVALRVARHLERAGDARAALEAYEAAATAAQDECSYERVATAASAALGLLPQLPASAQRDACEIRLRLTLGPALLATSGYGVPALRENCERGLEVARTADAVGPQIVALLTLSAIHQTRGDGPAARRYAEELVELSGRTLPGLPHILAEARLGQILAIEGRLESARCKLLPARDLVASAEVRDAFGAGLWLDPAVTIHGFLGSLLLVMGYPEQGQREIDAALLRAEGLQHSFSAATAHMLMAGFSMLAGDLRATSAHCQRFVDIALADALMEVSEDGLFQCMARAVDAGDNDAVRRFAGAIEIQTQREVRYMAPLLYCTLAEAWARLGRFVEGLQALDAARARVAAGGEEVFLAEIHRLRGECLRGAASSASHLAEAESELRAAIAVARSQGARWFELKATTDWTRLLSTQGRAAEALPQLAAIYRWFQEGFDRPALRDAAALLAAPTLRSPSTPQ